MVCTMALLPLFHRPAHRRTTAARPAALPEDTVSADDEVFLDAPDEHLGPALVAAARGAYGPASRLLAGTRERGAWEDRDGYVLRLAAFARSRPEWLRSWRAAAPDDPDALLVAAQLALDHAWPSPGRAELLREVTPLITAAARADDRDPVPWRIALDHARGSRAGHRYVEELWEAAVRRAPHHYGCHVAALRYLAEIWRGAHRECLDFAERAAQDAPAGSPVQALPLRAAFICLADAEAGELPRGRLDAAADRAIAFSRGLPPAEIRVAEIRNLLMYVLLRLGRHRDALCQARLIGPYVTSFPWERVSDDPLGLFLRLRADAGAGPPAPPSLPPAPGGAERGRRADGHGQ